MTRKKKSVKSKQLVVAKIPANEKVVIQKAKLRKKIAQKKINRGKTTAFSYAKEMSSSVGENNFRNRISGKDIIYEVRTGATATGVPAITADMFVSPATILDGSRLRQFAPLYQRFRFLKFILRYIPNANVQYLGDVAVGYVADPSQEIAGSGLALIQQLTQLSAKVRGSCFREKELRLNPADMVVAPGTKYSCDPTEEADDIETYQGRLFFISDGLNVANTLYGRWELEWKIEFYDPMITKALNATLYQFLTSTDLGQTKPWGSSILTSLLGDSNLCSLSTDGVGSVLTFPLNGTYTLFAFYPGNGGAGLTSSSTIGGTATNVSSYIAYTNAQTGKYWTIGFTVADGGTLRVFDSAGTHPTGSAQIMVIRTGPGPNATLALSKKALRLRLLALEKQVAMLSVNAAPPYPPYPGLQIEGQSQTLTTGTATITDGNSPPKTVVFDEASSSAIGPEVVVPADDFHVVRQPKLRAKVVYEPCSDDD